MGDGSQELGFLGECSCYIHCSIIAPLTSNGAACHASFGVKRLRNK